MSWVADITAARADGRSITATEQIASHVIVGGEPVRYVPDAPADLLAAARQTIPDLSDNDNAVARMLASEGYGGSEAGWPIAMAAMSATIWNASGSGGPARKLRRSSYGPPLDGHYGEQVGRKASTARDPTRAHVIAARIGRDVRELARSATLWNDPASQDGERQGGRRLKDAVFIARAWHGFIDEEPRASDAQREYYRKWRYAYVGDVAGLDPYYLMLYRPERAESTRRAALDRALAIIDRGRAGDDQTAPGTPPSGGSGLAALAALAVLVWGIA